MTVKRYVELKRMLENRRRELGNEVVQKMRNIRTEGSRQRSDKKSDILESADTGVQEDIDFILVQLRVKTLREINEALERLEQGTYGICYVCSREIAENRLRVLPFATRCKGCEEARELAEQRERLISRRRGLGPLFNDYNSRR